MKKTPRFFCDNCGYEVGHEAKACPYCGRFFSSVRCPSCGFTGEERMFLNGCPMCGYSMPPSKPANVRHGRGKKHRPPAEPLPRGVLIAAFIALLAAIAFFSWFITR